MILDQRTDRPSPTHRRSMACGLLLLFGFLSCHFPSEQANGQEPSAPAASSTDESRSPTEIKYASDLERFAQEAAAGENAPGSIVFYGSSSIRLWNLGESFPERRYLNRGFGGSNHTEALELFEQVVVPLAPSVIVFYEGDNDIAQGRTASEVAADFAQFVAQVERHLPQTQVVFLSIKPSNSRWNLVGVQREANRKIEAFCAQHPRLRYVDLASCLLGDNGIPDDSYFADDRLHLNAAGYALWSQRVTEVLREIAPATAADESQ